MVDSKIDYKVDFPKLFEPKATKYSPANAYCLALASSLAYEDEPVIEKVTKAWGLPKCTFFNDTASDTQGFLAANEETIILAFRGTSSKADAISDLNILHVDGPSQIGEVHQGFSSALSTVWQLISDLVWQYRHDGAVSIKSLLQGGGNIGQHQPETLWITGHSLGAALATLAAGRFVLDNKRARPVRGLYTYGSPRVGNSVYARAFNQEMKKRTFRHVNNNDLVTRVPLRSLRYSHVGQLVYITVEGDVEMSSSFWDMFLDRVQGRLEDFRELFEGDFVTDGLEDHLIGGYIGHLTRQLGK